MNGQLATSKVLTARRLDGETASPPAASKVTNDLPARVAVADVLFEGSLDGAWWPRSRDVTTQLPSLLLALPDRIGRITRVSLNMKMWDPTPNRVPTATRILKVGWFTVIDPDLLTLSDAQGHRILLAVIPPETATDVAERALSMASGKSVSLTAAEVLALVARRS
jgi:uncharacterized protein DUF5994